MKTVAITGNRNIARIFFVLAALGGLYYLRRSGKSVSQLLEAGTDGLQQARGFINRVAPSTTSSIAADARV